MKGGISANWRVLAATLFSVVIVGGAYYLAKGVESPSPAQASTETALLQAIASRDTDGDGLPDWEEALYGTDSRKVDSFSLGMSDGEAVARGLVVPKAIADIELAASSPSSSASADYSIPPPPAEGTLTAAFTESFLARYLAEKQKKGSALSSAEIQEVAGQALQALSAAIAVAPDFKSANDLEVRSTSVEELKEFAVRAEAVLKKNTTEATKNETDYLKDALENDDTEALAHIASIAKAYRDSAVGLAVLPVPRALATDDLRLINAIMRLGQIAADFAKVLDDPLATMLALEQYPQAVAALGTAVENIGQIYAAAGVVLPSGTPGAAFVNIAADVKAEAQAKKP